MNEFYPFHNDLSILTLITTYEYEQLAVIHDLLGSIQQS